ncbi:MAG: hypothetical protein R3C16_06355 [Hyphomonadaceae bacterium]
MSAARLISFLPLAGAIGFALPVLSHPSQPGPFIQEIDERTRTVRGFQLLEDDPSRFVPLDTEVVVSVGAPQVFVFVARGGDALCGSLKELAPDLRLCAEELNRQPEIQLQIFDLIGDDQEKRGARAAVREAMVRDLGPNAVRYFLNALVRGDLWDLLVDSAPDTDAANRILSVRGRIDAQLGPAGDVEINLESIDRRDLWWIDEGKLIAELEGRFSTLSLPYPDQPVGSEEESGDFLFHGIQAPRQEERMVLLLRALLAEPDSAWVLATKYAPRTRFEDRALQIIRRHLEPGALPGASATKLAVYCAFMLFRDVYPRNRGRYLLYLARHLGGNKEVASFVADKLQRSTP